MTFHSSVDNSLTAANLRSVDKNVDRPNTTPIGQDRASQRRDVLFDPNLFEAFDLVICVSLTAFNLDFKALDG